MTAVAAALTVAGCSGGDSDSPKSSAPSAAAASDAATTSVDTTAPSAAANADDQSEAGAGSGGDLTAENFAERTATAMRDAKTAKISMTTTAAGQKISVEGAMKMTGSTPEATEKVTAAGKGFEIRMVDGLMYMNLGATSKNKWIKIDPSDTSNPLAVQFGSTAQSTDLAAQVDQLKKAITSVKKIGAPATVDGVKAQEYDLVVDTAKVTGEAKEQLDAAGSAVPDSFTYKYWVDDKDLVRKVSTSVAGSDVEMKFSDWGAPVEVKAPAESELLPGGLGALSSAAG
ncbi:hypothetical protein [Luteimicrobium album]|uniref:hypothetical protein n=1 Tax=Luteimicrobium album TaxID=1054550 RepID=UPI0024E15AAC|nr:hypothetical protein [Luteimicrobium album]